ncbi:MAG: hypothetical protein KC964_19700, partial [Candidatus Omnitrophica bacterium]|nr:hypothetical protein [Candidatus Omnitrophota bacterium]
MRRFLFVLILATLGFPQSLFALEPDETPARPGEWGFRPSGGETVTMNPPGFSWRPMRGATGYDLQVS